MEGSSEGRRDRKKRLTRLAISNAATGLFMRYGFETVSLAQVADAADVSVKTIFNHFGSKEDLFFDRIDEVYAAYLEAVARKPRGAPPLAGLHELLVERWAPFPHATWDDLSEEAFAVYRRFLGTIDDSPALRARQLLIEQDLVAALSGVLSAELGWPPDAPETAALAAMVGAILQLRHHVFCAAARAGVAVPEVRRQVETVVGEAFRRLGAAFPELSD